MTNDNSLSPLPSALDSLRDWSLHLLAAVNAIPFIGGSLGTYLSEVRGLRERQRVELFFSELGRRMQALEVPMSQGPACDEVSEEFSEVCLRAAREAARTVSEEKIRLLATVVSRAAVLGQDAQSFAEFAVDLCAGLSAAQIGLLAYLNTNEFGAWMEQLEQEKYVDRIGMPDTDYLAAGLVGEWQLGLRYLQSKGLVAITNYPVASRVVSLPLPPATPWEAFEMMHVRVTPLGSRLLQYLQDTATDWRRGG